MPYKFNFKQKSPKRRFLLILGLATFIACFTVGLMIMFWSKLYISLNLSGSQRWLFGSVFLIYGILRFIRLFREDPDYED
jgi:hypothetical protein